MGAIPREQHAGIYHVTTRSIAEEHIYRVAEDFVDFVPTAEQSIEHVALTELSGH